MDDTPNLELPFILPAQAQKHVTHNEALMRLDALVQLSVRGRTRTAPPAAPAEGERHLVANGATGEWAGRAGTIAARLSGDWSFLSPKPGWLVWVEEESLLLAYTGAGWVGALGLAVSAARLGVNATADAANRLAVASPGTLLSHEGAGHLLKINRRTAADGAGVVFQTGFSGRAEIGTVGDDHLVVKVSGDGATWREALAINPANGRLGLGGLRNAASHIQMVEAAPGAMEAVSLRNTSAAATACLIARFFNDVAQAGFFMNSSQRTTDGGAGGFSFFNDGGPVNFRGAGNIALHGGAGAVRPSFDNANTLGTASARWSSIWAANGTIQTSDAREKEAVGPLAGVASGLVDAVDPVLFRWLEGGVEVEQMPAKAPDASGSADPDAPTTVRLRPISRPGRRLHAGIMAQDLKAAMDGAGVDFGAWGLEERDDPASRQWVRPDQLVFVLWAALKETRADLARLSASQAVDARSSVS